MNELKLVVWNLDLSQFPARPGDIAALDVDFTSLPQMVEVLGSGWEPVSHNVVPTGQGVLLTIFLKRPIEVPDHPPTH